MDAHTRKDGGELMTPAQQSELDRAIERADKFHIRVMAIGRTKTDRKRVFFTNSHSNDQRWHSVVVEGGRLRCDCASRVICVHRACVHTWLVAEAAKKLVQAEARQVALEEEAETQERERAKRQKSETAPVARDSRGISIWK